MTIKDDRHKKSHQACFMKTTNKNKSGIAPQNNISNFQSHSFSKKIFLRSNVTEIRDKSYVTKTIKSYIAKKIKV